MLPVIFHSEVRAEIDQAYAWYEEKSTWLGDEFLTNVRSLLERIQERPEVHRVIYRNVRAALVRRFPYVVYYRVEQHQIVVLAIQHGRRNPRDWQARN